MPTEAPNLCMAVSPPSGHGLISPCVWNAGHSDPRHTWQISSHDPNHTKHRWMNPVHDELWQPDPIVGITWGHCNQCFRASQGILIATITWEGRHWHVHEFANPWHGRVDVRGIILAEGSWTAIEVEGSIPDNPDGQTVQAFTGPFGGWIEIWERGDRIRFLARPGQQMRARAITGLRDAREFVEILDTLTYLGYQPPGIDWSDDPRDLTAFPAA